MIEMRKRLIAGLLGVAMVYCVNATTVLYQDFNQLVDNSDHVVGGTVAKIESKQLGNDKKGGDIFTVITLEEAYVVDASGKEQLRNKVKLRYKGGVVNLYDKDGKTVIGEEGSLANGTPQFQVGEQVILFVSNNGVANMPFTGWGQGVFRVGADGGIRDVDHHPVVGLEGTDIVTETENGLMARGKPLEENRASALKAARPTLLESEGGEDTLVTSESIEEKHMRTLQQYLPMDVSNFISMIQERKAAQEAKGIKSQRAADRSSLFVLPSPAVRNAAAPLPLDQNQGGAELNQRIGKPGTGAATGEPTLPKAAPATPRIHNEQ